MVSLKITPVPFKSSNLAIPPSPFSPRSPLTPLPMPKKPRYTSRPGCTQSQPPKISQPLQWMWQCHQCRQTYPLGATRRCLEDGHEFCAGTSVVKSRKHGNRKIVRKHRACASEFDYAAWKALGDWRRECLSPPTPTSKHKKDCWRNCNYPSECRWGHKAAQTEEQYSPTIPISPPEEKKVEQMVAEEIKAPEPAPATTFDALLSAINHPSMTLQSLLSSTGRRKSAQKSPLTLHTVFEEDEDVDVAMADAGARSPSPNTKMATEQAAELSVEIVVRPPRASMQKASPDFEEFNFGFDEEDVVMAQKF